ncbi:MAG TPA: MFS transporter [Xanthobacteraceae bacterium]|nr:MFS transporter [Xanthobacteraceae bacterium]
MDAGPQKQSEAATKSVQPVARALTLSMVAVFATTLFMRAVDPVVPQIAAHFAIDPHTVALLATAFSLPYAITQPALGGLADAFGKARLMTWSLGVLVVAAAVGAAAPNISTLFASRVIAGVMAGGVFPIAMAIVADLVSVEQRQVAVSRMLGAAMTGNVLGSPIAGIAADLIGWRGVFVGMGVLAALAAVAALVGFRGLATAASARVEIAALPATYAAIFRNPLAKICFGAVMMEAICLYGLFPYIAGLLAAGGEPRAAIAGLVIAGFGIGGIIYASAVVLLLGRLGERGLMLVGGTLMGLALMLVALHLAWPVWVADFVALGLGFYMLHGVIQIYASELAPAARGSAMALHSTFFFFGNALGPVVYGVTLPSVGLAGTVVPAGAILIGVGLVCARRLRRAPG